MSAYKNNIESRQKIVTAMQDMIATGLSSGTAGNISVLTDEGMLISPTGVSPEKLTAELIVSMSLDGEVPDDQLTPSIEWKMHSDIYKNKPGIEAVVHCHSNYATILACAHKSIPALHYHIGATGGNEIPLANYATYGSQNLSDENLKALSSSMACLMANHGQIAVGGNLDSAMKLAGMVEELAFHHWGALNIGGAKVLTGEQMEDVVKTFINYGRQKEGRENLAAGNRLDK